MSRLLLKRCWIRRRSAILGAVAAFCARARRLRTKAIAARARAHAATPHPGGDPDPEEPVAPAQLRPGGVSLANPVERLINRLKQARRIATRYEKRADNSLAMIHIGMILLWLKPLADTAQPYSCILCF